MKKISGLVIFLLSLLFLSSVNADTIILENGNTVEGKIVEKTDKYIKFESAGVSLTYYLDESKSIDQSNSSLDTKQTSVPSLNNGVVADVKDEKDPKVILKKVKALYQTLETYKTQGTIVADMGSIKTSTEFNILLKKPNSYLISWVQNTPMGTGGMTQSGAVWNDGTQPYLFMGIENSYSKMKSDEFNLGAATGISGGAASTMPSVFLSVFKKPMSILDRMVNPALQGIEKVGNEDCYVISGGSSVSKNETVWISRSKYLIRKYSRSFDASSGAKVPELTDEQLDTTIKNMGLADTPEARQNLKDQMKMAKNLFKDSKMHGSFTETYDDISSPELKKEDFKFQLPDGVVLKESLF
jgi:hypothetical protein